MASDWQTVVNKKKSSKGNNDLLPRNDLPSNPPNDTFNSVFTKSAKASGSNITRYDEEFIYSFKQLNKDQMVSYELSSLFDKINDLFRTSTQYLESKKKVNHNQHNHNRWELKKEEDTSVINIVCCGLNKITEQNYIEIIKEIEAQEIVLYDELEKLADKIAHKCISEPQFIKLYVSLIKHIMLKCKWIVDDVNMIPITFRRLFMNQLETRFSNLVNDVKNMKYDETEDELIVIHNKQRKGLIELICELYTNQIIGNQLIRYIFRNLETAYETTGIEQYLEYWLLILKSVSGIWIVSEKQYLDEQIQYIKTKNIKSMKLKFMFEDIEASLLSKAYKYEYVEKKEDTSVIPTTVMNNETDDSDEQEESYELQIMARAEYDTVDSWYKSINSGSLNLDKFLMDLLELTMESRDYFDQVKEILKFMIDTNVYTGEQVKEKINNIRSEYDLSDVDFKFYQKHLNEYEKIV